MAELLQARLGTATALVALAAAGLPLLGVLVFVLRRSAWLTARLTGSRRSMVTDLAYVVLGPFTEAASRVATTLAVSMCAVAVGRHVGPELVDGFGPVADQPRWLIVVEMLVLSDFVYYWVHRAAHTIPALFRLHAVHHSTRHLRWTSALRAHPGEIYLHVVTVVPLFLLGFPVDALVPLAPLVTFYAILIHININVSLRSVSYFVNTPVYHGWHHALDVKDGTKNFAGFFPLFDALFGTYRLPAELPTEYGIDDSDMPETFFAQLWYPFRARQEARDSTPPLADVGLGSDARAALGLSLD
jgi:sterol desaturase/sphingolipid hydroxylase (fatty acid hydroxylase superfamily)